MFDLSRVSTALVERVKHLSPRTIVKAELSLYLLRRASCFKRQLNALDLRCKTFRSRSAVPLGDNFGIRLRCWRRFMSVYTLRCPAVLLTLIIETLPHRHPDGFRDAFAIEPLARVANDLSMYSRYCLRDTSLRLLPNCSIDERGDCRDEFVRVRVRTWGVQLCEWVGNRTVLFGEDFRRWSLGRYEHECCGCWRLYWLG